MTQKRGISTKYRLIAAVPPLIGALFVSDLGQILEFTGIFGMVMALSVPAILALRSRRAVHGIIQGVVMKVERTLGRRGGGGSGDTALLSVGADVEEKKVVEEASPYYTRFSKDILAKCILYGSFVIILFVVIDTIIAMAEGRAV